ncbi:hypothetical protein C8R48DRAFT_775894 [Suillus tomentosus]|nr:hypothetical protein C8R48DRAFT_775894 [Suillus tomentosus]
MHPFHNEGWEHSEKMQTIIPLGGARGHHVFHPGGAAPSITNPDSDLTDATPQAAGPSSAAASPLSAVAGSSSTATTTTSITSSTPARSTAMSTSTTAGSNASKQPYSVIMGALRQRQSPPLTCRPCNLLPPIGIIPPSIQETTDASGVQDSCITKISRSHRQQRLGGPDDAQGSEDLVMQAIKILEGKD